MWSGDEHIKPTAVAAEAYLGDGGHSVGMARTLGGQGRYYSVHLRDGGPDGDDQRH
jgi:hypothetical protein